MKLWIRSQDKKVLANVKNVRFCKMKKCELKETPCTIKEFMEGADAYCVECNGDFFGEYATRERCLEIIDEIQKLLFCDFITVNTHSEITIKGLKEKIKRNGSIIHFPKEPLVEYHGASTVVYEMPEK